MGNGDEEGLLARRPCPDSNPLKSFPQYWHTGQTADGLWEGEKGPEGFTGFEPWGLQCLPLRHAPALGMPEKDAVPMSHW